MRLGGKSFHGILSIPNFEKVADFKPQHGRSQTIRAKMAKHPADMAVELLQRRLEQLLHMLQRN
jgi:hypothetical protein